MSAQPRTEPKPTPIKRSGASESQSELDRRLLDTIRRDETLSRRLKSPQIKALADEILARFKAAERKLNVPK